MSSLIAAGVALLGVGFVGSRYGPRIRNSWPKMEKQLQGLIGDSRYKGGFQSDMDKYEAGKILGINLLKTDNIQLFFQKQDYFFWSYIRIPMAVAVHWQYSGSTMAV